jgi:hypothetical protein
MLGLRMLSRGSYTPACTDTTPATKIHTHQGWGLIKALTEEVHVNYGWIC